MAEQTSSESHLTTLCRKAFLGFWAHSNPHFHDGKRAKELCDLLVVFGQNVILFSDKHSEFGEGDSRNAWKRWYKKAVIESAKQISGAERSISLKRTLYRDHACQDVLDLEILPDSTVHRIVTVRGAREAARKEWGGEGSLMGTGRTLLECEQSPFRVGALGQDGKFFHVFDQHGLDAVLATLDTAPDFLEYLTKREQFFRESPNITVQGEENLLGLFLGSFDTEKAGYFFPPASTLDYRVGDEYWLRWFKSDSRLRRDHANSISYSWDSLIEKFFTVSMAGTSEFTNLGGVAGHEQLLRWFASETRFRRRVLARDVANMMETTPPFLIRRKHLLPAFPGQPHWVFLLMDPQPDMSYQEYRMVRRGMIELMTMVVRYLHPTATDIVGLATGRGIMGDNFDALHFDGREWNENLERDAKRAHEELGFFSERTPVRSVIKEFPD